MRRDSKIRRYRRLRYLLAIDLLEFVNYTERFLLVHLEDIRHELKHNKCLISNVRTFSSFIHECRSDLEKNGHFRVSASSAGSQITSLPSLQKKCFSTKCDALNCFLKKYLRDHQLLRLHRSHRLKSHLLTWFPFPRRSRKQHSLQ